MAGESESEKGEGHSFSRLEAIIEEEFKVDEESQEEGNKTGD